MTMKKVLMGASAATILLAPFMAQAADPISNIGLMGSHNRYKLTSKIDKLDNSKERMPKGGIYYNFGNKLTGEEGFIYQAGAHAQYGKKGDVKNREAQLDLDGGYRLSIDKRNYVDGLLGVGYEHSRYDDKKGTNVRLTNKMPFAKAGVGFNHQGDTVLTRLEVGSRYNIDATTKVHVQGLGNEKVDMKNKHNPYAELTFMWDKGYNDLPITAGLYYTQHNYKLKTKRDITGSELKNDEYGVKVGLAF